MNKPRWLTKQKSKERRRRQGQSGVLRQLWRIYTTSRDPQLRNYYGAVYARARYPMDKMSLVERLLFLATCRDYEVLGGLPAPHPSVKPQRDARGVAVVPPPIRRMEAL